MALLIADSVIVKGSVLVTNDDILKEYKGDKDEGKKFLEEIGRCERYHCNENENTLTMGVKAAQDVLRKNNLTGNDIDLIAFCSQFPEYTMPSQSLVVHHSIGGKKSCVTLDINANCLGMLRGLDMVNRYFKDKNGDMERALIIGSDYASRHMKSNELVTSGTFADGACALLLEYTQEKNRGIIGSLDRSISGEVYRCLFPECGLSSIDRYTGECTKTSWLNPDTSISVNAMREALDDVLTKHSMEIDDIDWFCGSQFAKPFFDSIADKCEIPSEKRIYVGDKYGYTGTSSPFFAFTEGVASKKIKKGDVVFFTTVGVGISICSMLVRA